VSVRLGTLLHVTFPHDWQMSSATADIPCRLPDSPCGSSACNFAASFLGASSAIARRICRGSASTPADKPKRRGRRSPGVTDESGGAFPDHLSDLSTRRATIQTCRRSGRCRTRSTCPRRGRRRPVRARGGCMTTGCVSAAATICVSRYPSRRAALPGQRRPTEVEPGTHRRADPAGPQGALEPPRAARAGLPKQDRRQAHAADSLCVVLRGEVEVEVEPGARARLPAVRARERGALDRIKAAWSDANRTHDLADPAR
jgi:hypothetical protein